jgi:signal peptidase I
MGGLFRFLIWVAILVGVIVGGLRLVALRWVRLPENDPVFTTSLLPTLEGGDLVILQRIARPEFGDLVLCPEPNYPERYVIGRVIGLPGDDLRLKDNAPEVNGKTFPFERVCDPPSIRYPHPAMPSEEVEQQCYYEALASQRVHKVGRVGDHKFTPEDRRYEVPEGHFFLVSDNRLFPYDSRDYGVVPLDSCKETVALRLVGKLGWTDVEKRMTLIQ